MATPTITKPQLLEALRNGEKEVLNKLASVPASAFERGCYENGWNGRQVLAHIAAIEWTYPKLIDIARSAGQPREKTPDKPNLPTTTVSGGIINSYNDRQIERYAGASVQELLEVFRTNRAATIAAFEGADDDLLSRPIKTAGGTQGPLGHVVNLVAVMHVAGHVNDIVQSASQ
jgi:hypothetical protein